MTSPRSSSPRYPPGTSAGETAPQQERTPVEYLVAGLVLVAALAAVNAALTVAVTRRWRARMSAPPAAHHGHPGHHGPVAVDGELELGIAPGDRMPAFTAVTAQGATVTREDLAGREV